MKLDKVKNDVLIDFCVKNNKSLTPTRTLVYNILSKFDRPISAYEIQKHINKTNKLNISTIYRVLEFFMKLGLIHKLATINKFMLCVKPHEKHIHMINLCTKCENVIETCNKVMGLDFKKSMTNFDMVVNKTKSIEIPVLCNNCI